MTTSAPRRTHRLLPVGLVALLAVVASLAALLVVLPRTSPFGQLARTRPGGSAAAPVPTGDDPAARLAAIREVLARRSAAVRHDDAAGWAATQTAHASVPVFGRLAALPLTRFAYTLGTPTTSTPDTVVVPVRLTTRLVGEDADATSSETLTLRRSRGRWYVAAEATRGSRAALWDLGTVTVVRGSRSLVVGIGAPRSVLTAYAASADRAVPAVSRIWGTDWNRRPVVIVPRTVGQLARLLGRSVASLDGYAAVTTAEGVPGDSQHVAQRVLVNTPAMADLSRAGRDVVLRHELTHVATHAPERSSVPLWLVEGAASWTGYRGSGIPTSVAVGDLVHAARSGRAPDRLPVPSDFEGDGVDVAYESSMLAVDVLVQEYGVDALVRVYRATAGGAGEPDADLAAAVEQVTGRPIADLVAAWRARLQKLAA